MQYELVEVYGLLEKRYKRDNQKREHYEAEKVQVNQRAFIGYVFLSIMKKERWCT